MRREFHVEMTKAREASSYPHRDDFATRAGLSIGGYRKIEEGSRVPTKKTLDLIIDRGRIPSGTASLLYQLRDSALAAKVGLPPPTNPELNLSDLSKRMAREAKLTLKQYRLNVRADMESVLQKRFEMMLRAAAEE